MLLNLASVAGASDKDGLWGFIKRYAPDATPETHPDLDQAAKVSAMRCLAAGCPNWRALRRN